MNPTQIQGIIRAVVSPAIVWLSARGFFPSGWITDAVALTAVIGTAVWSYYSNSTPAMVKSVARDPDVVEVITTPGVVPPTPKVTVAPLT